MKWGQFKAFIESFEGITDKTKIAIQLGIDANTVTIHTQPETGNMLAVAVGWIDHDAPADPNGGHVVIVPEVQSFINAFDRWMKAIEYPGDPGAKFLDMVEARQALAESLRTEPEPEGDNDE